MTQNQIEAGTKVVRIKGDYVVGRIGTVIEVKENRAHVNWTHDTPYDDPSRIYEQKNPSTWVSVDALHPTVTPYSFTTVRRVDKNGIAYRRLQFHK